MELVGVTAAAHPTDCSCRGGMRGEVQHIEQKFTFVCDAAESSQENVSLGLSSLIRSEYSYRRPT